MQHATVAPKLQVWQAFFVEELWNITKSSSAAPVDCGTVNPGLHPGDLDGLIETARLSGDVALIDAANRCAALGNMCMDALDVAEGKQARPVLETLH